MTEVSINFGARGPQRRPPSVGDHVFAGLLRIGIGTTALLAPELAVRLVLGYAGFLVLIVALLVGAFTLLAGRGGTLPWQGALLTLVLLALGAAAFVWPETMAFAVLGLVAFLLVLSAISALPRGLALQRAGYGSRALIAVLLTAAAGTLVLLDPRGGLVAVVTVLGVMAIITGLARFAWAWRSRH